MAENTYLEDIYGAYEDPNDDEFENVPERPATARNLDERHLILNGLLRNQQYASVVAPKVKTEWLAEDHFVKLADIILEYIQEHRKPPTPEIISLILDGLRARELGIDQYTAHQIMELVDTVYDKGFHKEPMEFLLDRTNDYCSQTGMMQLLQQNLERIANPTSNSDVRDIVGEVKKMAELTFRSERGLELNAETIDHLIQYWTQTETIYATGWDFIDKTMGGGSKDSGLYVWLGNTNIGKTMLLVNLAVRFMARGHNVMFVTGEDRIEWVYNRILGNLIGWETHRLKDASYMEQNEFKQKVLDKLKESIVGDTYGKLVVDDFPVGGLSAEGLVARVEECERDKGWKPQIMILDYVSLMTTSRKTKGTARHLELKMVAEDLRDFAKHTRIPVHTTAQTNKEARQDMDFDLDVISESFGVVQVADWVAGIAQPDSLKEAGKWYIKVLKTKLSSYCPSNGEYFDVDRSRQWISDNSSPDSGMIDGASELVAGLDDTPPALSGKKSTKLSSPPKSRTKKARTSSTPKAEPKNDPFSGFK